MAAPPIAERHKPHFHRQAPFVEKCRVATTANITISTDLNNGDTLDGISLVTGDRVLVKDQSSASQNGIYEVGASPARAYDESTDDANYGYLVFVVAGTANAGTLWKNTNTSAPTIGATSITFAQMSSGTGGRPPYDYVVAASDSIAGLQAIADAVCDGTADQVEINAAIAAMVASTTPYSVLLLPGTYNIAAAIDFTGLTAKAGIWNVFEASGTLLKASANMTTMIKLDPGAGGQIVTCLDARFGKIDGNKASKSVTQLVNLARFNDNILRFEDVYNGSGHGINVAMSGVGDYPCANNAIFAEIIRNMGGTAFRVTANAHPDPYGFQGNSIHIGEMIANDNGIILGGTINDNVSWNAWYLGVVEHNTNAGIYDYAGGNVFIVANTNSNGTYGIGGPSGTFTYRSVFIGTFQDTIASPMTDQHFIQNNGSFAGVVELAERSTVIGTPASGFGRFYSKNDGTVHWVNDSGTDYDLTATGSGTVTSVALTVPAEFSVAGSPVTTTGTLAITKANESANTVWAGPTSGSAAAPTFRALVDADIPSGFANDHEHVENVVFSGDGATTVWTLPVGAVDATSIDVYVAGDRSIAWVLSGSIFDTLTFDAAPASGTNNIVIDIVAAVA